MEICIIDPFFFGKMSLKSVNDILGVLEQQAKWQEQPFPRLLQCWAEVVGAKTAMYTQPVSIQRGILWVATSSAAWSQNLTFGRQALLVKLNQKLPTPLVDIRFSTAGWQSLTATHKQPTMVIPHEHPSFLGDENISALENPPDEKNVNTVFGNWAKNIQVRSHNLPLCPQCQCPTPPGELQRWHICSPCAAKRLADKG